MSDMTDQSKNDIEWGNLADSESRNREVLGWLSKAGREKRQDDSAAFEAAERANVKALAEYEEARAMAAEARGQLESLQCRVQFDALVPGPYDEDVTIELRCGRTRGHEGAHSESLDEGAAEVRSESEEAAARWRESSRAAAQARARWNEAEDLVDELRCKGGRAWCVKVRGHEGPHDKPDVIQVVG